jgi:ATP adenylyltransferase/5',5'''-P-1,P-4-tetraphosphate phosphorylase II
MSNITSAQADNLIKSQIAVWPQAAGNFEALANVKVKELDVDGMRIKVQFNPARIVSSSAKVDAKSLKERKCFLCGANRPAVQEGIEWGPDNKYIVLINPFPIFPRHLTIPDQSHVDQLFLDRVEDMFYLARELDEYTVFYNGPKCGASAPDHMHFQAGNSDFLTIAESLEGAELKTLLQEEEAILSVVDTLPLKMFVLDATDYKGAAQMFRRLYEALPIPEGEKEPMMNVLCYSTPIGERMVIIPRKRHRPSFYGTEGEGTMLLSPASVDMGGVFITPLEKDFNRLDADLIRQIFDELCLSKDEIDAIAQKVANA